jgi:hypothetical protein
MEGLFGFIAFFATVFGIIYLFLTTRHKERLALIEKGADASLFNTGKEKVFNWSWSKFTLKIGMLAIGIGLGIIAGAALYTSQVFQKEVAFSSMIFLFGGISLVVFYLFDRKS